MCLPSSFIHYLTCFFNNGSVPLEQMLVNICRRSNEFQWITTNHTRKECFFSQFRLSFHPLKVSTSLVKFHHLGNIITRAECCPPIFQAVCAKHLGCKIIHQLATGKIWMHLAFVGSHLSGWLVRASQYLCEVCWMQKQESVQILEKEGIRELTTYTFTAKKQTSTCKSN